MLKRINKKENRLMNFSGTCVTQKTDYFPYTSMHENIQKDRDLDVPPDAFLLLQLAPGSCQLPLQLLRLSLLK